MRGKYFRCLFENPDGGLFHTGTVYDKEQQTVINYVYMAGSTSRSMLRGTEPNIQEEKENVPRVIHILVVGAYSANFIKKLIAITKKHEIQTAVLPYLTPIQRLVLAEELKDSSLQGKEAAYFLQDPYRFLKELGVQNIYFLYGNGTAIQRRPEELEKGIHFEMADSRTLHLIREMEGYTIPVVRAGYIIENDFLFYFGVYGLDIRILSNFAEEYFSHLENIHELSENANEDYASQMTRLVQEFLRQFGNSPSTTIVMFEGPLHTSLKENESFMTQKEFSKREGCEAWAKCEKDSCCACSIRCNYSRDYDNMQRHKRGREDARFGMMLLGNANLNRYFYEIAARFLKVISKIRGITVPNCGSGENWNHRILELFSARDRIYWICGKHDMTSAGVVSDIVLFASNNRFLTIDEEWGCCLSGYIIPKDDID